MSAILLSGPASEPVSLVEAKAFLRVGHDDDDETIAALVVAARSHVEALTRRALIAQSWRVVLDAWPADRRVRVLPAPLRELVAARVYPAQGFAQALDPATFTPDTASAPGVLAFASAPPPPGRLAGGIELDVEVGYGDDPADVPEPLRQAVRLLAAHWYENRGVVAASGAGTAPLPQGVAALIAPYKVLSL